MAMNQAKIAELKTNLSAYLSRVRNGETIVVCDRSTPIARLVPYDAGDDLVVECALDPARNARKIRPVTLLKAVDVDRVLSETRTDR